MVPNTLLCAVVDVLSQGSELLHVVDSETYRRQIDGPPGASIGAHYRHVLDHFRCLLDGAQTGQINYDRRRRNPAIENSIDVALLATETLIAEFQTLPAAALEKDCTVIYNIAYGQSDAAPVRSNFAREVMFNVGHAIHHFAILKLLCAAESVSLPYEFGVAPSTLKYLETHAAH
jgi:hypothetical protein